MCKCIDAILNSEELSYKFPRNEEELDLAAEGFRLLRSQGAIKGCFACLYGFFTEESDHKCRFLFAIIISAPVAANNIAAIRKTKWSQINKNLPAGKFLIGTMHMFALIIC